MYPLIPLSDVVPENIETIDGRYFPVGVVSSVDGKPGQGKSTLMSHVVARLSAGLLPYGQTGKCEPINSLFAVVEDTPGIFLDRILASGGLPEKIKLVPRDRSGPRLAHYLIEDARRTDSRLIVIDPVHLWTDANLQTPSSAAAFMGGLTKLARRAKAAVVIVRHPTKAGADPVYSGGGATAVSGACRSIISIAPNDIECARRVVTHVKNSWGRPAPLLGFRFVANGIEFEDKVPATLITARVEKIGVRVEAAKWLIEEMSNLGGTMWTDNLQFLAGKADISWGTVKRACSDTGTKAWRDGGGREQRWYKTLDPTNLLVREFSITILADQLTTIPPSPPQFDLLQEEQVEEDRDRL